jgi:hypothetical protein
MKNKNLSYIVKNEIPERERKYIDSLSKYFEIDYYKITNEEIISFIESDEYANFIKPREIWRLLCVLSNSPLIEKIKSCNNLRLPDVNYEFRKIDEFVVPLINLNTESEKYFFTDRIVKQLNKFEIYPELLNIIKNENDLHILKLLKIKFFNENDKFDYIFNNLNDIYCENNTIDVIKTLFKKWKKSSVSQDETNSK